MTPALEEAALAVAEGREVDWTRLDEQVPDGASRNVVEGLRVVAGVAALWAHAATRSGNRRAASPSPVAVPGPWGPLQIVGHLGSGTFGDVYRARDPRIDREVALKILRRASRDEVVVVREARLLARIRHPNVVTVYGADCVDGRVGFWMELVDGDTLADTVARSGPLPPETAVAIARDVARAVAAVHQAGLLHRDIKAQNVIRDRRGQVLLADLGAGCDQGEEGDVPAGTPLYMAPETFASGVATERSDVYAIGVLLFYLLTGTYPVRGRTVAAIIDAHRAPRQTALSDMRPDLPRSLQPLLEGSLAADPSARTPSAEALAAALDTWARPHRPQRGHLRRLSTTVSVATLGGLAVAATLTWRAPVPASAQKAPTARRIAAIAPNGGPSPDGRWLSHTTDDGSLALIDTDRPDETARVVVSGGTRGRASYSVFAPDGQSLAYAWRGPGGTGSALDIASIARGDTRRIFSPGPDRDVRPLGWSPDGRSVVTLVLSGAEDHRLTLVDTETGTARDLQSLGWRAPVSAVVSPDGQWLVWDAPATERGPERDIHARHIVTGEARTVVEGPSNDYSPHFAPDGRLFFLSDRARTTAGWVVEFTDGRAGSAPTLVMRDLGPFRSRILGLTARGQLVYGLQNGIVDVYTADIDPATRRAGPHAPVSARLQGSSISPDWSADGTHLAYVTDRGMVPNDWRSRSLTLRRAPEETQQIAPELSFFIKPRLSPNGASVLVKGRRHRGHWGLHQVNLASGAVHATYLEDTTFGDVEWVSSSRVLYTLDGKIHDLDIPTGRTRRLCTVVPPPLQVKGLAVSPDRDVAVVSLRDPKARAWRALKVSLNDCNVSELIRVSEPDGVMVETWWPAADTLIVSRWTDGPKRASTRERLAILPAFGGPLEDLGVELQGVREARVRPDGRRLAFTAGNPTWEIWMAEHFLAASQ